MTAAGVFPPRLRSVHRETFCHSACTPRRVIQSCRAERSSSSPDTFSMARMSRRCFSEPPSRKYSSLRTMTYSGKASVRLVADESGLVPAGPSSKAGSLRASVVAASCGATARTVPGWFVRRAARGEFAAVVLTQQTFHLGQRFVQFARILAAAAGLVGLAAAFAADDGGDGLNDFPGLHFGGELR